MATFTILLVYVFLFWDSTCFCFLIACFCFGFVVFVFQFCGFLVSISHRIYLTVVCIKTDIVSAVSGDK